jgi:hypothetical protein
VDVAVPVRDTGGTTVVEATRERGAAVAGAGVAVVDRGAAWLLVDGDAVAVVEDCGAVVATMVGTTARDAVRGPELASAARGVASRGARIVTATAASPTTAADAAAEARKRPALM